MNYQTVSLSLPLVSQVKESPNIFFRTPMDVCNFMSDLAFLAQESFQILTINAKNGLINRHLITLGLLDSSLVHPREVFRAAILDSAKYIILVHNHPSGDPTPSAEDIRVTRQIVDAGRVIDIPPMDHIIFGRKDNGAITFSMRETGTVNFCLI